MSEALDMIDQLTRSIQRVHLAFQTRLKLEFAVALEAPDAHSARAVSDLKFKARQARSTARQALSEGESSIADAVALVIDLAMQGSAGEGPRVGQALLDLVMDAAVDASEERSNEALDRDVEQTVAHLRKLQTRALIQAARGIRADIAFKMVKDGAINVLSFTRVDTIGRRWDMSVYTRTMIRHALVWAYVQTYCLALVARGVDLAAVEGGPVFSITGDTLGYPTLEEVTTAHFHPNATRLVTTL